MATTIHGRPEHKAKTMMTQDFIADETGAATVDWVVLAAACVALAIGVSEVTANAMATLSNDVRAELTNTDPSRNYFDEIMNLAIFSDYVALSDAYGEEWNGSGTDSDGNTWAMAAYNAYAGMNDADLVSQYEYHYELAVEGAVDGDPDAARSVDHMTVVERIMSDRDLATPDDNLSASEVRALYEGGDEDGDDGDD